MLLYSGLHGIRCSSVLTLKKAKTFNEQWQMNPLSANSFVRDIQVSLHFVSIKVVAAEEQAALSNSRASAGQDYRFSF